MTMIRLARAGVPILPLLLAGCTGGLLGGGKPDQLFRFGLSTGATATTAAALPAVRRTVALGTPVFPPEIAGDRILTSEGREVSYVKDARWVTATPVLYRSAIEAMLRARVPDMAVLARRRATALDGELQIKIDRFEAAYDAGAKAPPTIHIQGQAMLLGIDNALIPPAYTIDVEQAATANSVSGIAAAFDVAVMKSSVGVADWVSITTPLTAAQSGSGMSAPAVKRNGGS